MTDAAASRLTSSANAGNVVAVAAALVDGGYEGACWEAVMMVAAAVGAAAAVTAVVLDRAPFSGRAAAAFYAAARADGETLQGALAATLQAFPEAPIVAT